MIFLPRPLGRLLRGVSARDLKPLVVLVLTTIVVTLTRHAAAAEIDSRQLVPDDSAVILEVKQPQVALQHALVKRLLPILQQSRGYQDATSNPDLDLLRDSVQHFEQELGVTWPQILEGGAGEGLLVCATAEQPPQLAAILTGRDAALVGRLPEVALSLARKIVAGRGQNLPEPIAKSHAGQPYFQFGEAFYATVGPRWILVNREATLQKMLDLATGKIPLAPESGLAGQLSRAATQNPGVRLIVDIPKVRNLPQFKQATQWPPRDVGQVILAVGWFDLILRSQNLLAEIDLGDDTMAARIRFSATAQDPTPGTVGYFASEPNTGAAPLLEPAQTIYSVSWFRDYARMWENRDKLQMPEQARQLEMQIASVEKGNLGYSGFDMIRLIGPQHRFVVTRPGPNPYKVEMTDRLPALGLVLSLRNEKEFNDKVLLPIQRILGIVAVTNKMVAQTIKHQGADISALRFTEDPAAVKNSDRIRYNFEPSYSVTRGHLVIGSTSATVRNLIDELDRLKQASPATSSNGQNDTEQQRLNFNELARVLSDIHGLAVRNAVLNDGLTISEAESELNVAQQVVAAFGQLRVHGGFSNDGFEYRVTFDTKATP